MSSKQGSREDPSSGYDGQKQEQVRFDQGGFEENEEEEEEEYIESEPVLAYYRMKNSLTEILQNDSVSCIKASHKMLIIGTHWGKIHIMDHDGNKTEITVKQNHETTVNDIAIDAKEEYVASCGDDGRVIIFGLFENTHNQSTEFNRPIKSVELDPNFSNTLSFVTGDTKLVLTEKGFMGRRKTSILHEGEGVIRNIKWCNDLIAWSNEKGVKIYSVTEKRIITYISKDHDPRLRDELYRCCLLWLDPNTLAIGWADRFKICKVVRSGLSSIAGPSNSKASNAISAIAVTVLPSGASNFVGSNKKDLGTHVEIISMVETDFYICGLAAFKDHFLMLCYEKPENDKSDVPEDARPHIRVIEAQPDSFEEISFDAITIKDYEKNRPFDYRLDFIQDDDTYFILSPKDIIKATSRCFDDHIKWLIEHHKFEEALDEVRTAPPNSAKIYTYQVVAVSYIDYLIFSKKFKEAAEWCSKITLNSRIWEEKILIFEKEGQLEEIFDRIPSSNPTLEAATYERVLGEFLRLKNYEVLKYLIKKWPCNIYDLKCVTSVVLDELRKNPDNRTLLQSVALLYEYQKSFDKTFEIYIKLSDQTVFDFLFKHSLYECAYENIIQLINLNKEKAIKILVDNVDKIPVKKVVEKLMGNKLYLHLYLYAIFEKDPNLSREFHTIQVALYADFQRDKLLHLLQTSQDICLTQAQKDLQERSLGPEIVYILERTGQFKKALQIVVHSIKEVNQAIEFCKKHNDKDLWEYLIQNSLNKPDYIIALLNNIGTHVDPVDLIDRVPNGLKIKGLRDALVKILQDYRGQISLLEGSKNIMAGDCLNLMQKQVRVVKQAIVVEEEQRCIQCDSSLIPSNPIEISKLRVFECGHTYHEECIEKISSCTVCSKSKHMNPNVLTANEFLS